jgi:hypothetical protein
MRPSLILVALLACGRSEPDSSPADAAESDAAIDAEPACEPTRSCNGLECGTVDDGCGTPLGCGTCGAPETCGATNECGCDTTCTAQPVASASHPTGIALDANHVYWYAELGVARRGRAGGMVEWVGGANEGTDVVVDSTYVLWNSKLGADVLRHRLADSSTFSQETLIDEVFGEAAGLTLHAGRVYFASVNHDAVGYKPVGSASSDTAFTFSTASAPRYLTANDTHFFWHETLSGGATRIVRKSKAGGAVEPVIADATGMSSFAGHGSELFVANAATNKILRVGADKTVSPFADGQDAAHGFSFDGTYVYWADGSTIVRAPITGGAPKVLATAQNDPHATVTDGVDLYWTNDAGGQVMQLPLCGCAP